MGIEHQKEVPLAAVIGSPIGQSLSPDLHNYWLVKNNLKGYYIPLNVNLQMLEKTINLLPKLGFKGANVTIPHKTNVLSMVDKLTDRATMIGAVNTLHFNSSGQITGDNTDAYGFIENIKQKQPHWDPKKGPALVYGAGGAARAIVWALLHEGVPEVRISNRTKTKAISLSDILGAKVKVIDWTNVDSQLEEVLTLVNTTSLGMIGNARFSPNISKINSQALVVDLVYNPLKTDLLKTAKSMGLKTVDGLGMLLHQGVPGFEKWFGVQPKVTEELEMFLQEKCNVTI